MEIILNFLKTDTFLILIAITNIVLVILYIAEKINLYKIKRNYMNFIKKIGNGNNIDEMLKEYIKNVEDIKKENKQIENYCKILDNKSAKCLQKVGMVRYNAFQDTGSDLSFALSILDEYNNGIVLNGIYSREMSNIYAKPVEQGKSPYTLSEEEKEAIQKAINNTHLME